jgi:predicted Fe-Mo cluster-binding NifX family protein
MKVAISATANHPASSVELHFEHAPYYIIIDLKKSGQKEYKAVHNPGVNSVNDVGILAAQMLINLGIDILITGWCDPHALRVFQKAKIPIYKATTGTVQELINTLKENEFNPDKLANTGENNSLTTL